MYITDELPSVYDTLKVLHRNGVLATVARQLPHYLYKEMDMLALKKPHANAHGGVKTKLFYAGLTSDCSS